MRTATQRVGHHHYRYGTPVSAEEERERKKRTSRNVIQEKENNLTKAPLTAFVMAAADRREKREADGRDHRIWVGEGEWLIRHILVNAPISRSPGPMPIHLFYFLGGYYSDGFLIFFIYFSLCPDRRSGSWSVRLRPRPNQITRTTCFVAWRSHSTIQIDVKRNSYRLTFNTNIFIFFLSFYHDAIICQNMLEFLKND